MHIFWVTRTEIHVVSKMEVYPSSVEQSRDESFFELVSRRASMCLRRSCEIALVSWAVLRLLTGLDAWLHGTDTAPSGSSPPPRRGRKSQGAPTWWPQWGWVLSLSPDTAAAQWHRWPLPSRVSCCCPSQTCRTRRWGWWAPFGTPQLR